ncbi:MAG TPA: dihydrolipoyllysine-residue acetyltransferase [Candidatus Elarobacter sp.]|jgi:pyruvate dehydrogenase E2 component (dihydrolipoamide acetyltransferase)
MAQIDLTVPDLGGFDDVPVIEVLVKPGDVVKKDDPLVTLESDKATMEVPAYASGTIADVKVKVGDKVSQGTVLATAESSDASSATAATAATAGSATTTSANDALGIVAADAGATMESAAPPPRAAYAQSRTSPDSVSSDSLSSGGGSSGGAGTAAGASSGDAVVELTVPDLGGFGDVPVIEVLVAPGETVAKDAPLVTLESDKATMEVPASSGGTIRDVRVKVGDKVSQGTVLATVATGAPPPNGRAVTTTAPPQARSSNGASAPAPAAAPPASVTATSPSGPVHASPAIRRFARELGVDLGRVRGSGPNARITRDDVQSFVKTALVAPPAPSQGVHAGPASSFGLALPPWPSVDFAKFGPVERVALTRIQKISGPVLARNWVMIPHVTQNDDADVTDLEAFRKQINTERKDVKVTMLAFLMKAAVAALKRFPQFNASLDGDALVLKKYYHLGFAADTPNGLLVPVIKDVDKKGVVEIAAETAALAAKARDGKLGPNDMSGATFTISSLGSIGGTYFTPIINAPEVAILGACKADTRPVWDGKQFVPRLIQPLSLSYDHRVIDGANAARFTVEIKNALSDLRRVLL